MTAPRSCFCSPTRSVAQLLLFARAPDAPRRAAAFVRPRATGPPRSRAVLFVRATGPPLTHCDGGLAMNHYFVSVSVCLCVCTSARP
jgi:hypothetical protein